LISVFAAFYDNSPTKTSHSGRSDKLPLLVTPLTSGSLRTSSRKRSPERRDRGKGDGTFLTECSFGVAHDQLVQVITDVQAFEPHWRELKMIDLSNRKIESVARLKELLPRLESLRL